MALCVRRASVTCSSSVCANVPPEFAGSSRRLIAPDALGVCQCQEERACAAEIWVKAGDCTEGKEAVSGTAQKSFVVYVAQCTETTVLCGGRCTEDEDRVRPVQRRSGFRG
eukprot:2196805-Rhodomonas_salina.1